MHGGFEWHKIAPALGRTGLINTSTKLIMNLEEQIRIKWTREEKGILLKQSKGILYRYW